MQRLENWPLERRFEINLASCSVSKAQPDYMAADVTRFDHVVIHDVYSSGAIRFSG